MVVGNSEIYPLSLDSIDLIQIKNPELVSFLRSWLTQRGLNREIYSLIPDDKSDFKPTEKSPSVRENIIYQIKVHDNYLKCIKEGKLEHGKHYEELNFEGLTKDQLLKMWDNIDIEIVDFLSSEDIEKQVSVPWSKNPVSTLNAFWGLENHEIYHLGRNSVTLEALNIPRPDSLKKVWG